MRATYLSSDVTASTLRALNYTPEIDAFRRRGAREASASLGSLVRRMGDSYGKVFVRYDCDPGSGEELITQGDMFAAEPAGRIIRGDALPRIEDHRVHRLDVLIAAAGTLGETELFGRCIIADDRLAGRVVGPHAMKLSFHEPDGDIALFTYAFLNTRVGIRALRSTAFGTKILGLRQDLLRSLPVPLPAAHTQRLVSDLIRVTIVERERYQLEVRAARAGIERLPEMQEADEMSRGRKPRSLVWSGALTTLNAWNYGSAGVALGHLRSRWPSRLRDVLGSGGVFNGPHFARIGCKAPHGIDFCSQRDVFLIRPIGRRIMMPAFSESLLFVQPGCLLVGSHGQLNDGSIFGKVLFVDEELAKYAFTQDILRIYFEPEHREVAYAFLSTEVGSRLLRSTAVGTSIPSMHLGLLCDLPFPDLPPDLHARVTSHVRAAMKARAAATAAEQEAIRIVEEEVLPQWLA